jgi:hypothetical protein
MMRAGGGAVGLCARAGMAASKSPAQTIPANPGKPVQAQLK